MKRRVRNQTCTENPRLVRGGEEKLPNMVLERFPRIFLEENGVARHSERVFMLIRRTR